MARGYCERCNKEKPTGKGGFCPDYLTHTNTYYTEQTRNDLFQSNTLLACCGARHRNFDSLFKFIRRFVEWRNGPQFSNDLRQHLEYIINIFFGICIPEGQAQRTLGDFRGHSYCPEHM